MRFALLCFFGDANLADRTYWYLDTLGVRPGERVIAPVGPRDGLQCARVERVLCADPRSAPYDIRLCKRIAARYGAHRLKTAEADCVELGGFLYDEKHYTRFGRILAAPRGTAAGSALREYGVVCTADADAPGALAALAEARGCALLYGDRAAEYAVALLLAAGVRTREIEKDLGGLAAFAAALRTLCTASAATALLSAAAEQHKIDALVRALCRARPNEEP